MKKAKRTLKLILPLCSPRMLLETALIIQLCIFMTFCLNIVSPFISSKQFIKKAEDTFDPSMIYFQPCDRLEHWLTDDYEDLYEIKNRRIKFEQQINALFPDCEIGTMFISEGEMQDGTEIQVAAFSSNLLKDMGLSSIENVEEGYIPAWYKGRKDAKNKNITVDFYAGGHHSLNMQIFDSIAADSLLVLPRYGSTMPTVRELLSRNVYESFTAEDPDAMLITDINCLPENISLYASSCLIISPKTPIDITPSLRQKANAIGGQIFSYEELIENSYMRNLKINQIPLARFIASTVFTLVSLIGYVFLGLIRNRRTLGIYATNGMSKAQVKGTYLKFLGFLFILALMAEILLLIILTETGALYIKDINGSVVLITALGYMLVGLFAELLVKHKLAGFEIAKIMRKGEE